MSSRKLPLFDVFIETPFEHRFQDLLQESWRERSWHVIVAEPGSGKTMGICDLRDEACRQAGMIGGRRYPILAVTAPKNDPREAALGNHLLSALGLRTRGHWGNANICSLNCWVNMAWSVSSLMMPMTFPCLI